MKNNLANCILTELSALRGLLVFRIAPAAPQQIEYAKVYSGFQNLKAEYSSADAAYGLGAIDLYTHGVIQYPCEVVR